MSMRTKFAVVMFLAIFWLMPGVTQAASVTGVMRGDALKWQGTVINLDPLKNITAPGLTGGYGRPRKA